MLLLRFAKLISVLLISQMLFTATVVANTPEEVSNSIKQETFSWDILSGRHTNGIISKNDSIQVNFNSDVIDDSDVGKNADKVIAISPAIDGTPIFESRTRIVWKPTKPLTSGASYKVSIKPDSLKNVPKTATAYQFGFRVIPLEYQVETHGLNVVSDSDEMMLQGALLVSDSIDEIAIKTVLKAKYKDETLPIEWVHSSNGKKHQFTVRDIKRANSKSTLHLSWNGEEVGIDTSGKKDITIPGLDTFDVTSVEVIHKAGSNPFVEVRFSDELDLKQNLKGLVEIVKTKFTGKVKGNVVSIYPKNNLKGSYKVRLHSGIKAKNNNKVLSKQVEKSVVFDNAKPQVRFVGKGTILPSNSILDIPFDAVGVNAVEVTAFEVYADNVADFLQTNSISGSSQIQRNGRYLWRKTIPVNPANPNQWNRFSFDVTELMKSHAGGLIRLSISINRSHSSYACANTITPASPQKTPLQNWEDNNVSETSGWDGISDYVEGASAYNWEDRLNPCTDSYYMNNANNTSAEQNFIASNIGLIAKQDAKGNINVISTDIRTAKPLPGTEFEVRNFQGQVLSTGTSDGSGFSTIKTNETPFLLVAKKFKDTTYLKLNTKTALSISHFDVGGDKITKGIKGYIYGERGVWRPGDDIFLTFVLQNKSSKDKTKKKIPDNYPVMMKLIDPQGRVVKTKTSTNSVGGFYAFNFKTAEEAQTGNWLVKAYVGGSTFSKSLMIETVRPNRLKMELSFQDPSTDDKDIKAETLYSSDGALSGTIFSQWLHGATASKLKTDLTVRFSKKKTSFGKYTDHVFDDPARSLRSQEQTLISDNLDDKGFLHFNKALEVDGKAAGMLKAHFTSRVFENGGAFSISRSSFDYHPFENYLGVKLPKGDASHGMLLTDTMHTLKIASLDAKGKNVSVDKVQVSLYKIHWKWWWDKSSDSLAQYADSKHSQLLKQDVVSTSSGTGEWQFQIKYPDWGRYLVRACDMDGGHCTGKVVYIDWPGWAGRAQEEGSGAASRLNLFSDQPSYSVGDTAIVQLPAAAQGRALLTVETGSEILEQRWVDFDASAKKEGEEDRRQFELEITEKMTPNVYVHMTLLQPHEGKSNDRPIRLYGIIPLKVEDLNSYLFPKIEASNEWKPESKQTVKISEDNGKEMNYTLAIVDEGLLGLTAYKTPNLHGHFNRKEALGIKTWDLFDDVVGAYGGKLDRMLALGGGDNEDADNDDSKKRRFPPVVKYLGPFNLKAGQTAEHDIELPPYLGAVRVMLVAANMNSDTIAYGKAQQSIFVRQSLMLQTSLPRVLGPNETVTVPISLFVTDESINAVKVSLQTDDLVSNVGGAAQQLGISEVGEKTVFLRIKTGDKAGKTHLKFTATGGANGEHQSVKDIYLDIRRANQETTRSVTSVIEPNGVWKTKTDAFGIAGSNQSSLELSSLPSLNLQKRLDYLTKYPHGCLEQTTSAVFPQLYLSNVMSLNERQQQKTQHHVRKAVEKLQQFQIGSGDFSYWPGGNHQNAWASIYAGHFLLEAQKQGYILPDDLIGKWLSFQAATSQQYVVGSGTYSHTQAYRLYVLALAGKPQLGAMNRLRESANVTTNHSLNKKARWLLASAYQTASQPEAAQSLIQGMSLDVEAVDRSDQTFSSTLGDLGLQLESLVALNKKKDANKLLEQIASEMTSDSHQSTQGIAWALMGVSRYLDGDTSNFSAKLIEENLTTDIESKNPLSTTSLFKADGNIAVKNTSGIKLFANVTSRGIPTAGKELSKNNGLSLSLNIEGRDADDKKHWNNISDLKKWQLLQGSDTRISVTINNTSKHKIENIALTIPAAAGMEIVSAPKQTSKFDYVDLRDDRIHYYLALKKGETKTFSLLTNASYQGRYYQPAITAEAMYDGKIKATVKGRWLDIVKTLDADTVKQHEQNKRKEAPVADAASAASAQ